jgi:hypothetical protein
MISDFVSTIEYVEVLAIAIAGDRTAEYVFHLSKDGAYQSRITEWLSKNDPEFTLVTFSVMGAA